MEGECAHTTFMIFQQCREKTILYDYSSLVGMYKKIKSITCAINKKGCNGYGRMIRIEHESSKVMATLAVCKTLKLPLWKIFFKIIQAQSETRKVTLDFIPHASTGFHFICELRPPLNDITRPISLRSEASK